MTPRRVLVLTASYGEGHNSAARALVAGLQRQPGVTAEKVDLFAEVAPRLDRLSRQLYLKVINHAPAVWAGFYGWLDRTPHLRHLTALLPQYVRAFERLLDEKKPDALCATYPVYGWLAEQVRRRGRAVPPLYVVVTDALTINAIWFGVPAQRWFVTDAGSAQRMIDRGVTPSRVTVSGFPVASAFADRSSDAVPPDPASGGPRRVLLMINCSRRRATAIARAVVACPGLAVTITAGRSEDLRRELASLPHPTTTSVEVLGWTDRIPDLLMRHHLVISKAGGATTQESINALCPMIVSQVVRGQEEGNWELLKAHDAGTLATTPEQVVAAITAAFAHGADQWKRWRRGLEHLARPTAASDIARQILSETAAEGGPTTLSPAAPTASSVACPPDRTTHRILTG
jgi:processive 1,2-diacylglycerol beta-glucosyltransferase